MEYIAAIVRFAAEVMFVVLIITTYNEYQRKKKK